MLGQGGEIFARPGAFQEVVNLLALEQHGIRGQRRGRGGIGVDGQQQDVLDVGGLRLFKIGGMVGVVLLDLGICHKYAEHAAQRSLGHRFLGGFFAQQLLGHAHGLQLAGQRLGRTDLLEDGGILLVGNFLPFRLVGVRGFLQQNLDGHQLVQHLQFRTGRQLLAIGGGIGAGAGQHLIQFAALDGETVAFGDHRIAKQRRHGLGRIGIRRLGKKRIGRIRVGRGTGHQSGKHQADAEEFQRFHLNIFSDNKG